MTWGLRVAIVGICTMMCSAGVLSLMNTSTDAKDFSLATCFVVLPLLWLDACPDPLQPPVPVTSTLTDLCLWPSPFLSPS